MLSLRFARAGRRNAAFFRIVLTDHSKPSKSGFIKVLGWYDPKTKKSSVNKEEVLSWVKLGAMPSNSLAKFLESQKISHKNIKFTPDAPKKPKEKGDKTEKTVKTEIPPTKLSEGNGQTAENNPAETSGEQSGSSSAEEERVEESTPPAKKDSESENQSESDNKQVKEEAK